MRVGPLLLISLLLTAGCIQAPASRPASAPQPHDRSDADAQLELAIFDLVNAHRRTRGLTPLTLDTRMNRLARLHSAAMATGKVRVGHEGFADRAALLGQGEPKSVAENIAYDLGHADPAAEIVRGWLQSRDHRQNIEGFYQRTGIGAARNVVGEIYVTQLFLGTPEHTRGRASDGRPPRPGV